MEKITNIKKFVKKYKEFVDAKNDRGINALISTTVDKRYISFIKKVAICNEAINNAMTKENGILVQNSAKFHLLYNIALLEYTCLDVNEFIEEETPGATVKLYDLLKSTGILDRLIAEIPESEYVEFDKVWNMTKEDYVANNTGTQVFIKDQVSNFATIVGNYINVLGNDIFRYFDELSDDDRKRIISLVKDQFLPLLKDKDVRDLIISYFKK
jgi:hypothetical protein